MSKYFSPSSLGFYDAVVHGGRTMRIPDPAWVRPTITIEIPPGETVLIDDEQVTNDTDAAMSVSTPDIGAIWPKIVVDNPDCHIPADAVEISDEEHAALINGQSSGLVIGARVDGYPELQPPPPPTPEQILRAFQQAHDDYINAPALARNYDSFATFALRAARPGPWQAEGIVYFDWMEECNAIGFALLADVKAGNAQPPASIADYLALLPVCPLGAPA